MPRYSTRRARKGLTEDGSTRAWRRVREQIPGPKPRCAGGKPPHADHIKPRRDGGKDVVGNLRWRCPEQNKGGRPRGT